MLCGRFKLMLLLGSVALGIAKEESGDGEIEATTEAPADSTGAVNASDADDDFPQPSHSLPEMVEKSREFAKRYLSKSERAALRDTVLQIRKNGGSRSEVHRAVLNFLTKTLSPEHKKEISERKAELVKDFGAKLADF